jgi:DNA helicase-2/ATP-dependent DNA helicase PcrA
MDTLLGLRETGTIGDVADYLMATGDHRLPEKISRQQREAQAWRDEGGLEIPEIIMRVRGIRARPYSERMALVNCLDDHTPFATQHSVKGEEFENVLVVLGRGWNQYNFDQFLELSASPGFVQCSRA